MYDFPARSIAFATIVPQKPVSSTGSVREKGRGITEIAVL